MDKIETVADYIVESKRIVVFTGAGFSTESGVPDFRSPGGVWDRFDPSELNLPNFLRYEDIREKYWRMHKMMWETIRDARPNSGHLCRRRAARNGQAGLRHHAEHRRPAPEGGRAAGKGAGDPRHHAVGRLPGLPSALPPGLCPR